MDEPRKNSGDQEPREASASPLASVPFESALPKAASSPAYALESTGKTFDELHLTLSGTVSIENAESFRQELLGVLQAEPLRNLVVDLAGVEYLDSAGTPFSCKYVSCTVRNIIHFSVTNASPRIQKLMMTWQPGKIMRTMQSCTPEPILVYCSR